MVDVMPYADELGEGRKDRGGMVFGSPNFQIRNSLLVLDEERQSVPVGSGVDF